jgi:hypothetical protein
LQSIIQKAQQPKSVQAKKMGWMTPPKIALNTPIDSLLDAHCSL